MAVVAPSMTLPMQELFGRGKWGHVASDAHGSSLWSASWSPADGLSTGSFPEQARLSDHSTDGGLTERLSSWDASPRCGSSATGGSAAGSAFGESPPSGSASPGHWMPGSDLGKAQLLATPAPPTSAPPLLLPPREVPPPQHTAVKSFSEATPSRPLLSTVPQSSSGWCAGARRAGAGEAWQLPSHENIPEVPVAQVQNEPQAVLAGLRLPGLPCLLAIGAQELRAFGLTGLEGAPLKVSMSHYECEARALNPQIPAKKRLPVW
mmetsp:Transcript_26244/g.57717  ORF Transcript_26244/g.57717 Transcript_26244/m.57717 type:complete len:264 (-) Transcript_26244:77-868(-)